MSWPFGSSKALGVIHKEGFPEYTVSNFTYRAVWLGTGRVGNPADGFCYNSVLGLLDNIRTARKVWKTDETKLGKTVLKGLNKLFEEVKQDIQKLRASGSRLTEVPACFYKYSPKFKKGTEARGRADDLATRIRNHERTHARIRQMIARDKIKPYELYKALQIMVEASGGKEAAEIIEFEYGHGEGPEEAVARAEEIVQACKSEPTLTPYLASSGNFPPDTTCGRAISELGWYLSEASSEKYRGKSDHIDAITNLAEVIKQAYNNSTIDFVRDATKTAQKRWELIKQGDPTLRRIVGGGR